MKKISYLMSMAVALIMGFTSCSSDDVVDGGVAGQDVVAGEPTVVRLSLNVPTVTRTLTREGETVDPEKVITNATIYIFDSNKRLDKIVPFTEAELIGGSKVKDVETKTGTNYFYAVVNYGKTTPKPEVVTGDTEQEILPTVPLRSTFAEVRNHVLNYKKVSDLTRKEQSIVTPPSTRAEEETVKGFVMTSLNTTETPETILPLGADNSIPAENKITITVGRAVAKVKLNFNPKTGTDDGKMIEGVGDLTDVSYKILNNPAKTHVLPSLDSKGYLVTPSYNLAYKDGADGALVDPTTAKGRFLDVTKFIFGAGTEPLYTTENSNLKPKTGNATTLMIKAKLVADKYYKADGTEGTLGENGNFYLIKIANVKITPVVAEGEETSSTTNEEEFVYTKIYAEKPNDTQLEAAKEAYKKYYGYTSETIEWGDNVKIYQYIGGYCYYTLPLEKTEESTLDVVKKHTVMRNNLFTVNITSISEIGSNTSEWEQEGDNQPNKQDPEEGEHEDGTGTDKPNKPEEDLKKPTKIQVKIEVEDWTEYEQNSGI